MSEQGILLPFYLVVDVSYSMNGPKMEQANQILPAVADALAKAPILADKVRFGLLDFSDDAQVVLPLSDMTGHQHLPKLAVRGGTDFGAAFRTLRERLHQDVAQLRADGFKVHRPAVFFLSDGEPQPGWEADFAALTEYDKQTGQGFKWYPVLVPCGVDEAGRDTMRRLVHPYRRSKLYMMRSGADAADAIRAMAEVLISSVLASGQSAVDGSSGFVLPDRSQLPPSIDVDDDWLK
ncbi:VWA domain-containing protein [Actinoplanes sp. DH11]|uniref:vWA domain-containing protein n=1 Tax=Actinoplanes sp. DH11 TaxID=2857011 RepID=UPI001E47DC86|nr:VWA domain-containing protein [Actinoplanes sp. DH11]